MNRQLRKAQEAKLYANSVAFVEIDEGSVNVTHQARERSTMFLGIGL